MAELITLARPYAKAAFNAAKGSNALGEWSDALGFCAYLSQQGGLQEVLETPSLTSEQKAQLFIEISGDRLNTQNQNFIRLLADNKRLELLAHIAELFEQLKAAQEQSITVEISSAYDVSSEQEENLAKALTNKFQREIKVESTVDSELLGGAVIRAGDSVIDASVRGKLLKLAEAMNS